MSANDPKTLAELFDNNVISACTRAQLIEDGDLFNMMQGEMAAVCRQHFKYPIACTRAVFAIIQRAVENPRWGNDYAGVVHDILWMSKMNKKAMINESTVLFEVIIKGAGRKSVYQFKMMCGPNDDASPCMTIMLPEED